VLQIVCFNIKKFNNELKIWYILDDIFFFNYFDDDILDDIFKKYW
jgi:hypothetical protein